MDGSRIPYALLICWLHVVAANVPPPTNVTLHCHNMQNTLQWSYEDPPPGLKFKVFVGSESSDPVLRWVSPPAQSIDLSDFSDPDNSYSVTVTAVNGSEESTDAPEDGIEFSYFKDSPATKICSVDLPLVNVTTLENKRLHFSFTHPGLLYPARSKLRRKKSSENDLPEFHYHVEIMNQKESHKYACIEEVCEGKLPVNSSEEIYCLNITGEMRKMSVRATKKFCSIPFKPHRINVLVYVIPVVLVLIGGLIIALMLYIKKTRPSTSDPKSLTFFGRMENPAPNGGSPSRYDSFTQMGPTSPEPLISSEERTIIYEDESRLPLGGSSTGNEPEHEQEEVVEESQDAGYTRGTNLERDDDDDEEKEGNFHSAYEQRACLSSSDEGDSAQSNVLTASNDI